ncbi:MAG: DUF423 domain-containing protein [Magnetococcales bacterium]|nr:DUF423 domain-containing protein [Magnetococcales bacterium]PPR16540.1 MAG: hypothetical protein CFH43_00804 [Pseudomonadota bacterium]|tara:strand:- start:608 stop:994 length:387 start_codon:yes stop_codon:yes gene_type:complete
MILKIAAILGFISVAFGAYADHGLSHSLSEADMHSITTAVRYNQLYAILIAAIGLTINSQQNKQHISAMNISGYLFITGTVLFSFGIYSAILLKVPALMHLAPLGGFTLMSAWLSLIYIATVYKRHKH